MNYLKNVYLNWFTIGLTIGLIPFLVILYTSKAYVGTEILIPVVPWLFNFLIKEEWKLHDE